MAMCERCGGRGRLTEHSVPCVGCNGTGEVGPFKVHDARITTPSKATPGMQDAFRAGYDIGQQDADDKRYDANKRWSEYQPKKG